MNESLSAEEGADRVWKRLLKHGPPDEHPDGIPDYRCENCGHAGFLFGREFMRVKVASYVLPCSCGSAEVARRRTVQESTPWRVTSTLGDDHRLDEELEREAQDRPEREEIESEIECPNCVRNQDHASEEQESESDPEDMEDYFTVCCGDCGHEIEFGWSHENRGGRIWPVESRDFNPRLTFSEERFVDAWIRRGWVR